MPLELYAGDILFPVVSEIDEVSDAPKYSVSFPQNDLDLNPTQSYLFYYISAMATDVRCPEERS